MYAKICCLCNEKLVKVMMTVPLPQLQAEKHFVSVVTIFLWSIWITLKPLMTEILLSSLGSRVKRRPWLCQSSFGMADVWSTISYRGHCWPNCPKELRYAHRTCLFTVSVCMFVFISLLCRLHLSPGILQSYRAQGGPTSRTSPHRCPYGGLSQAWGHRPLLHLPYISLSLGLYLKRMFYFW